MLPDRARPVVDVAPVHQVVERHDVAVGDVLGLVRLEVEDVGTLAGRQRGLQRRVEAVLLVPGDLDVQARDGAFPGSRAAGLAERHLGRLVGLVAPDRDGHVLGVRAASATRDARRCGERRHQASPREARCHLRHPCVWPRLREGPAPGPRRPAPLAATISRDHRSRNRIAAGGLTACRSRRRGA